MGVPWVSWETEASFLGFGDAPSRATVSRSPLPPRKRLLVTHEELGGHQWASWEGARPVWVLGPSPSRGLRLTGPSPWLGSHGSQ